MKENVYFCSECKQDVYRAITEKPNKCPYCHAKLTRKDWCGFRG